MVELTEIKDDVVQLDEPQFSRNQAIVEEKASATNNDVVDDEDDSDSDFEDEFDENETLLDRIVALKDIVPPGKRQTISNFFGFTSSFVRNAFTKSESQATYCVVFISVGEKPQFINLSRLSQSQQHIP